MSAYMVLAESKSSRTNAGNSASRSTSSAASGAVNLPDYGYEMYGAEYGYHEPSIEDQLEELARELEMMKRAFDSNPEDMLDDIHGEIMDVVHEAGGEIERSLDKAEQDFQHWCTQFIDYDL